MYCSYFAWTISLLRKTGGNIPLCASFFSLVNVSYLLQALWKFLSARDLSKCSKATSVVYQPNPVEFDINSTKNCVLRVRPDAKNSWFHCRCQVFYCWITWFYLKKMDFLMIRKWLNKSSKYFVLRDFYCRKLIVFAAYSRVNLIFENKKVI